MNQKIRKTALLMGALVFLGLGYSSNANASGSLQEVQQATKKITGTVVDAQGPVIGASVMEKRARDDLRRPRRDPRPPERWQILALKRPAGL